MSIQLQIENTSVCNAACSFCPYPVVSKMRTMGNMPLDLYKKIIDEAATIPLISQICITGLGEPLLDPHIIARVDYARKKKPDAFVDVFTNGVYLTPARFIALRDAGVSSIQVSLNATDADQHKKIMGLDGKFDKVCENIDFAIKNSEKCGIEVRAVIDNDNFTRSDGYIFYDRWGVRGKNGHGMLIQEGNWSGDGRTIRDFKPNEACFRALSQIYVLFDGKVTSCCFDPVGKQIFGDLSKQTIREMYSSPDYVAFREAHADNQADKYEVCATCTRI